MKVISYTALHYGVDYLEYAIRSVIDHVDEHWVLYTPIGSHGHRTDRACPDSRDDLYAAAWRGAGDKLRWVEGTWAYEGQQRESIHQYAPDATCILVVDADEIWPSAEGGAFSRLDQVLVAANQVDARNIRLKMVHFWRSFNKVILRDPAYPVRIIFPHKTNKETTLAIWPICHMGYAQRSEIVRYKLETHGHKNEFRRDVNWFDDVFMTNRQYDTHPVGSEYWHPEHVVDPFDYLPEFMRQHPYAQMEIIE